MTDRLTIVRQQPPAPYVPRIIFSSLEEKLQFFQKYKLLSHRFHTHESFIIMNEVYLDTTDDIAIDHIELEYGAMQ